MRKIWIPIAALLITINGAAPARAGTARSGQLTAGKGSSQSAAFNKLVGTWRFVALQTGTRRQPMPYHRKYTVTLRADGTFKWLNMPVTKAFKMARWSVKGRHILIKMGKKTQKMRYVLKGDEVTLTLPSKMKYCFILKRVSKP